MASTLDRLAYEAGQLLKIIGAVASVNGGPAATLRSVGWDLPPGVQDLGLAAIDVSTLVQKLDALDQALSNGASDAVLAAQFAEVFLELQRAIAHVRAVIAGLSAAGDYLDRTQIKSEILERLSSLMIASRVGATSPLAFVLLQFFGVITLRHFDADPSIYQVDHVRVIFDWDALTKLFTDPLGLLESRYGWGTATFDAKGFIVNLNALVEMLGEPSRVRQLPRRVEEQLSGTPMPEADTAPATQVIGNFITGDQSGGIEAGISLFPLRPTAPNGMDGGIAVCPFVYGTADLSFPLSAELTLEFQSTVALDSGVALQFRPGHDMSIKAGLLTDSIEDHITGTALVSLTWAAPDGNKYSLVSLPGGGIVEVGSISFAGGVDVLQGSLSPSFALKLTGGHAMLSSNGADSFVSSLIPAGGVEAQFDVGVRWSATQGFSFEGSASAAIDIPLNVGLGGLRIDSLHLGLLPSAAGLAFEASVTCDATIGPVGVSLQRFGALVAIAAQHGNLGPIDVSLDFKAPNGVGLAIDAEVVHGGGFLSFDTAKGEYSGAMVLEFEGGIAVKALGLIATRLPDGAKGYSLMVIVTAEGFTPIQLGYGFSLTGIGGLVAINRTFDEAALRGGLKNHTLDSVMFPHDPIRNAPQILSNLNKVFPPANGHHLFGPMVQISWGTPVLITADVGVVLEFGARLRLLILAQVVAILPKPENDLVRLQMDAVGVLDFDQGTAALDATLYDSRLLQKFALTGDMAMRMNWEGSPNFALAIGGLHPAFNPPPNFPKLDRIAINLSAGDNPRIRCEAYFALTSNTVQFGARLELYASASGFSIQGETGFDVLIQLDPFYFLAEFYAQVQLKHGSTNLFKVRVEGALAGPRPLHIKGKATFEVLWWDVSIRIDRTLVEGEKPPAPQPIDVLPRLKEALSNAGNWVGQLPDGQHKMVTLRATPAAATDVLLHPLGTLTVKQSVVPLDIDISRFGQAAPAGARRFTISSVSLGGQNETTQAVKDFFAPAQFFEMSDEEKLSRPSFESMTAGIVIGSAEIDFTANTDDWLEVESIEFETIIVDKEKDQSRSSGPKYVLSPQLLAKQARYGAAATADIRRAGRAKYRTTTEGKYQIAKEGWSVVATDDLTAQGEPTIYSQAEQALQKLQQDDPAKAARLTILRLSELA